MNIEGLDYNTQREALLLAEYGREVHKMVELAISLPTKEERQRCAESIVKVMLSRVPHIRENVNYKQTLWDHLYLISHKQLDIDWPYDVADAEKIHSKPQPVTIQQSNIKQRHYGRLVEELTEKLKTMPAGEERDELVRMTAYQMKRDLMLWGHGSIEDEKVADDLARLTDGVIQLDLNDLNLSRVSMGNANQQSSKRNNKKKK